MKKWQKTFEVRWADLDPNQHMRHTAYNDYAAHVRMSTLEAMGLSLKKLQNLKIGPIIFNEYINFKKEIRAGETFSVDFMLAGLSLDHRKWRMKHNICNQDGILAAEITINGAWFSLTERKIVLAPDEVTRVISDLPKSEDFSIL